MDVCGSVAIEFFLPNARDETENRIQPAGTPANTGESLYGKAKASNFPNTIEALKIEVNMHSRPTLEFRNLYTWAPGQWWHTSNYGPNIGTQVYAIPCPDDFGAVRIVFANVTEQPYAIPLVKARASSSFNDYVNPSDGSPWITFTTFSQGGNEQRIISVGNGPTALTVPGTKKAQPWSEGKPSFTARPHYSCTDWVPIQNAKPDPDTGMRVLMIRHLVQPGQTYTYANGQFVDWENAETGGYKYFIGGYNNGSDFVNSPETISRLDALVNTPMAGSVIAAVQFRTKRPSMVGICCGDSHHAGTSTVSQHNNFLAQACKKLARKTIGKRAIGWVNSAVSGATSDIFFERLTALLPIVQPTFVTLPGWTFNDKDGDVHANLNVASSFFEHLQNIARAVRGSHALPIFLTPIPRNADSMGADQRDAWRALHDGILALRNRGEIVLDCSLSLCPLLDGIWPVNSPNTCDGIHPNDVGHGVLADQLVSLLERVGL